MIKKVFIIIILAILFVGIIFFKLKENASKKLELTYEINAGIPFRWEYEIKDSTIAAFEKSYVVKDENKGGLVGGKVATNYVFKGLKKGKTIITFKFVNFTTNKVEKEEKHNVKVDDNLNISLVAIDE